jgi:tRNA(fMet)-specific endonuclease VapC
VTPVLLDTNGYAAFKRGTVDAVEVVRRAPEIVLSTIVLGELLAGFAVGSKEQSNRAELSAFLASARVRVVPVDRGTAEQYAAVYVALRTAGTPIPTNDMWIAATALQHQLRLFTFDHHFGKIAGLAIGMSAADFA